MNLGGLKTTSVVGVKNAIMLNRAQEYSEQYGAEILTENDHENITVESEGKLWDVKDYAWSRLTTSTGDQLVYERVSGGYIMEHLQTKKRKFLTEAECATIFEKGKTQVNIGGQVSTVVRFEN